MGGEQSVKHRDADDLLLPHDRMQAVGWCNVIALYEGVCDFLGAKAE